MTTNRFAISNWEASVTEHTLRTEDQILSGIQVAYAIACYRVIAATDSFALPRHLKRYPSNTIGISMTNAEWKKRQNSPPYQATTTMRTQALLHQSAFAVILT